MYYDREGKPLGLFAWARLREKRDPDYLVVGSSEVGPYKISTVWIGLDHSFGGPVPLIFETMIFGPADSELDGWTDRYPTEAAAIAGHDQALMIAREAVKP